MTSEDTPSPAELIAAGIQYAELPHGNRADNLERSIQLLKAGVSTLLDGDQPAVLAFGLYQLAMSVQERIHGDRPDNLDEAIGYYELAVAVLDRLDGHEERLLRGQTLGNLGSVLIARDDHEKALLMLRAALRIQTPETSRREWGVSQQNLGSAYMYRREGNRRDNIAAAIAAYEAALRVRTPDAEPALHHRTRASLEAARREFDALDAPAIPTPGASSAGLVQRAIDLQLRGARNTDRATRERLLEAAVAGFLEALDGIDEEADSALWGTGMHNLGICYSLLDQDPENGERAVLALRSALPARLRAGDTPRWAMTQYTLAFAYANRKLGDPMENTEAAIRAAEAALEIITPIFNAEQWAKASLNLGLALLRRFELAGGDGDVNDLRAGITHTENGLSHTDELGHRSTSNSMAQLAMAYRHLAEREDDRVLRLEYESLSAFHLNEAMAAEPDHEFSADETAAVALFQGRQAERDAGDATELFLDRAGKTLGLDLPPTTLRLELRNQYGRAHLRRLAGDPDRNAAAAIRQFELVLTEASVSPDDQRARSSAHRGLADAYAELDRFGDAAREYRLTIGSVVAEAKRDREYEIVAALAALHRVSR
ncbi:tetratricopeptide repeat protein [Actinoplanes sp. NPDC049265]|uniref:tetratricopeptide repeat protein n=1 Tax=Actinoplanes sp. NPDC049265 TaxID=3363902 RepID=UPI0037204514